MIRVNLDPINGADYYNMYYDDFFDSNCTLSKSDRLLFVTSLQPM